MSFHITLPEFGANKTEDMIVSILINKYPLTVKQIHDEIRHQYRKKMTYQAVYKTVNGLIAKNIVEKNDDKVLISKKFFDNVERLFHTLNENYSHY